MRLANVIPRAGCGVGGTYAVTPVSGTWGDGPSDLPRSRSDGRRTKGGRGLSPETGRVVLVTETALSETVIAEALAVIDQALSTMQHRELVSSSEVSDLLLDLRLLLATAPEPLVVKELQIPSKV